MDFTGTAGNDHITGTSSDDVFDLSQGGNDTASGGDGNDTFNFGATFTANDSIDGGSGSDTVTLDGDYSAGVTFKATTMVNVETLSLAAGHSYALSFVDATAVSGQIMTIDASALGAADVLRFNGSKVSSGDLNVYGGAGNDVVVGGQNGNNFFMGQGGNDDVRGGAGRDQFAMGAAFTAADRLDGGGDSSSDTLTLDGDYSAGLVFKATTMTGIDTIYLAPGHSYTLTTVDATFAAGAFAEINGLDLGAGDRLVYNGSAETDARQQILGGAGADVLTGGAQSDIINGEGGADVINGGGGDDFINFNAAQASAKIDGGTGNDTLQIFPGFSAGYQFTSSQLTSIETFLLIDGDSYHLTSVDANVAAGQILTVDASQLTGANSAYFNGDRETNGSFAFHDGPGNDTFIGGAQADTFLMTMGGNDIVKGEAGNDIVNMASALTAADHIDGGVGNDTVTLDGDYFGNVVFNSTTMLNVETIALTAGHSYRLTTANQTVAAGQTLHVDGSSLGSADRLLFSGVKETDGNLVVLGGDGNDILVGGHGADTLVGGFGADKLTGGAGADTFIYNAPEDSTGTTHDTITDFDASADKFDVNGVITAVDTAIATGSLSTASFDSDLTNVVNAAHLGAMHAVLFTASAGTLSGDTFLIVDQNGTAGYQSGEDLVIQLTGAVHLSSLGTGNFI